MSEHCCRHDQRGVRDHAADYERAGGVVLGVSSDAVDLVLAALTAPGRPTA